MSRGVPAGARWTPVPDVFFSRYLPSLTDPVAVKVALHTLWRIHRRAAGTPPVVAESALAADGTLRRSLAAVGVAEAGSTAHLAAALDRLVADGLFLALRLDGPGPAGPERQLAVNSPEGRAALERLAAARPPAAPVPEPEPPPGPGAGDRAYIFGLYEDNIGLLTPLLAEELAEAAETYPQAWVEEAMRRAVASNARRWSYVRAILERWMRDGVDDEGHWRSDETARERDSDGPYAAWIER